MRTPAVIATLALITTTGITLAVDRANDSLRTRNAELESQVNRVAVEVRPCAVGWWCMVAVGLDGAERVVSLARGGEYFPPEGQ